jgi:hypothetical protein
MSSVDPCNDKLVGTVEQLFNKLSYPRRNQFYKLLARKDIAEYLEYSVKDNTTFAAIKKLCTKVGVPLRSFYQELKAFIYSDPVSVDTLLITEEADNLYATLTEDEREDLINKLIMEPTFLPDNRNQVDVNDFREYMNHNDGNIQIYWVMRQFFKDNSVILGKYRILMAYLSAILKKRSKTPSTNNNINNENIEEVNINALSENQFANRRSEKVFKYPIMKLFHTKSNMKHFGTVGELPPPRENKPSAKRQRIAGGTKKGKQKRSRTMRTMKKRK